jgi:hypothetical protein
MKLGMIKTMKDFMNAHVDHSVSVKSKFNSKTKDSIFSSVTRE